MKTTPTMLFLLFSLFVSSPVLAQITITTADVTSWYAVGKGLREIASDTSKYTMNVGIVSTTPAQTWTFPTVTFKDTMLIKNATPSSTPYASKYPMATHAQTVSMAGAGYSVAYYAYTRIANDSLVELGFALREIQGTKDTTMFDMTPQFAVKMPFVLGTVRRSHDSLYYGPGDYEVRDFIETIDAFGTITLPNGTFSCLRSKSYEVYRIAHSGAPMDTIKMNRFNWLTKEGHRASAAAWRQDQISGSIQVDDVRYSALVVVPTGVWEVQSAIPASFALLQNYPNPFNPSTMIQFSIPQASTVTLKVYDVLGKEIGSLVAGDLTAGSYSVSWNADKAPSGVYFYRLNAGTFSATKKLILMR